VWRAAEGLGYPFGPLVRLLILTGQRVSEVAEARWSEIDLAGGVWTVPAERSKNGIANVVPLSGPARALIEALPRVGLGGGSFLFTTRGERPVSGFSKAKAAIDSAIAERRAEAGEAPMAPWRLHDLRRTFATLGGKLRIPRDIRKAVLNHVQSDVTAIYDRYRYADEKSEALATWADFVLTVVAPDPAAKVTTLPSRM
jgi:integrase